MEYLQLFSLVFSLFNQENPIEVNNSNDKEDYGEQTCSGVGFKHPPAQHCCTFVISWTHTKMKQHKSGDICGRPQLASGSHQQFPVLCSAQTGSSSQRSLHQTGKRETDRDGSSGLLRTEDHYSSQSQTRPTTMSDSDFLLLHRVHWITDKCGHFTYTS